MLVAVAAAAAVGDGGGDGTVVARESSGMASRCQIRI